MAGCGYVCPSCDGQEVMEDGSPCKWCSPEKESTPKQDCSIPSEEEWLDQVHSRCCGDL